MTSLNSAIITAFDIFEKNEGKNKVEEINKILGPCEISSKQVSGNIGIDTNTSLTYNWNVSNLHDSICSIVEYCHQQGLVGANFDFMKKCITKIKIIGVDNELLPYFTLTMIVQVDSGVIDNMTYLARNLNSVAQPLRVFF